jgi:hypothetical protein
MTPRRWRSFALLGAGIVLAGCLSTTDELHGVADEPPLDRAVLVTGGAFLVATSGNGTFRATPTAAVPPLAEAVPFAAIVDARQRGAVFRRVAADDDDARRRNLREQMVARNPEAGMAAYLQQARADGFDLLLVIEELQDGAIENRGTNGRGPVTFATWILLGVGMFIPDRTFESRATLKASLRELQSGLALHELLLDAGPIELSLVERTDIWGLFLSIIVPPFWVGDDRAAVVDAVRDTTERRLLVRLARDLKSEVVRRRLDERAAAALGKLNGS